jgi:hypothetical protein
VLDLWYIDDKIMVAAIGFYETFKKK